MVVSFIKMEKAGRRAGLGWKTKNFLLDRLTLKCMSDNLSGDAKYRVGTTTREQGRGEGWARHKTHKSITLEVMFKRVGTPESIWEEKADGRRWLEYLEVRKMREGPQRNVSRFGSESQRKRTIGEMWDQKPREDFFFLFLKGR